MWEYICEENAVTFSYTSPDGEEGFPGAVRVEVTYRLTGDQLTIDYKAAAEQSTVVNLANHTYFNLGGHSSGTVEDHVLTLRTPTAFGSRLHDEAFNGGRGYDHNYVLDSGEGPVAELWCPATGIGLEMTTSMEGMQLYTAGWLTERKGKGGAVYGQAHGVCLETQHFPNAVNCPAFPSPILRKGETLQQWTAFRFFAR